MVSSLTFRKRRIDVLPDEPIGNGGISSAFDGSEDLCLLTDEIENGHFVYLSKGSSTRGGAQAEETCITLFFRGLCWANQDHHRSEASNDTLLLAKYYGS